MQPATATALAAFGTPQTRAQQAANLTLTQGTIAAQQAAQQAAAQKQQVIQQNLQALLGGGAAPSQPGAVAIPGAAPGPGVGPGQGSLPGAPVVSPAAQAALRPVAPGATPNAKQAALLRITAVDPKLGKAFSDILKSGNQQAQEAFRLAAERGTKRAIFVDSQKTDAGKKSAIQTIINEQLTQGEDPTKWLKILNMTEGDRDLELQRMEIVGQDVKSLLPSTRGRTEQFTKGTGVIVRLPDGTQARSVPVLNKTTGQLENRIIPLGGEPVSRIGETGGELTQRRIVEAGGTAAARRGVELETAGPIAGATRRGAAEETRGQTAINEGLTAADSIPILNRSIELLDSVETGGLANALLAGKQLFGVESANEAELSANLGKTVLSQLRSTFGAAFTEREGARLAKIEAGFGKSVAGNRRLLLQTKKLMERVANRGIKRAEAAGDKISADEIREAMGFTLTPAAGGTEEAAPQVIRFDAQGNIIQ